MSLVTVTVKNMVRPLGNQRGGLIGIIVLLLALVGGWYVYQSYNRGQLKSNLKSITHDYEHGIKKIIPPRK
jgi:type VI protein secretion system component VasK